MPAYPGTMAVQIPNRPPKVDTTGTAQPRERLAAFEIRTYRVLLLIGVILIPSLRAMHVAVDPDAVDPWWPRLALSALLTGVLVATWLSRAPRIRTLIYTCYYLITGWLFYLIWANQLAPPYAVALLVVVAGLTAGFSGRRPLAIYGGLTLLTLVVLAPSIPAPRMDPRLYLLYAVVLAVLTVVGMGSRMRVEEKLQASRERFALAAHGANDGLWDWNVLRGVVFYSTRWKALLGLEPDEVGGSIGEWLERVHPEDRERVEAALTELEQSTDTHFEVEYRARHADGSYRMMIARGVVLRDRHGRVIRLTGSHSDVTERKRAEQQLLYDALHDALTRLPNRVLFLDRLERFLHHAQRRQDFRFAVLFIDLDRFKVVNDSLGHPVGDGLLVEVARRLEPLLRPEDTLARLGGDEFAVLVDDVHDAEDAVRIAERIHKGFAAPFEPRGQRLYVTASIGIALGGAGDSTESLLRDADTAMYRAKRQRSRYALFDEAMHADAVLQLELENDIRHAIERREFVTHYQPLVRLDSGEIIGFEALVRWHHPQRGLLLPDIFVPLAEETGLISEIGRWVLDQSCALLQQWNAMLPPDQPFTLTVNVSGKQFLDEQFADEVVAVLQSRQVPRGALKLELTETAMMEDSHAAAYVLERLREHGVSVWIDDFGTGYSSLAYLQRLPVDSLKISRQFVTGLSAAGSEGALVRAIVSLAATLGMETIAEGVETEEQRVALVQLGCRIGQGWLFAPALDAEQATRMLQRPLVVAG